MHWLHAGQEMATSSAALQTRFPYDVSVKAPLSSLSRETFSCPGMMSTQTAAITCVYHADSSLVGRKRQREMNTSAFICCSNARHNEGEEAGGCVRVLFARFRTATSSPSSKTTKTMASSSSCDDDQDLLLHHRHAGFYQSFLLIRKMSDMGIRQRGSRQMINRRPVAASSLLLPPVDDFFHRPCLTPSLLLPLSLIHEILAAIIIS